MADIKFETGVKEFNINGAVTVRFSPTDMVFIEKVFNALEHIDKKHEDFSAELSKLRDEQVFDLARKADAEAREEINAAFGVDVCTPVFGNMSVYAVADGFPLWANLLLAVIDQFEGAIAEEKKLTNPRIAKYTAKYGKK